MTERARAEVGSIVGGLHLQVSKLLLGALIAAVAATGALIITVVAGLPPAHPPPPAPGTMPPPPPLTSLAVFPVVTGLFVLAWLAVVVAFSRDQILRRIEQLRAPAADQRQLDQLIVELRAQLAVDRERELQVLEERIAELTEEYGEQRETDGYLNGMRVATGEGPVEANVHSIRRTPPQR
ncbi:hypothetical protein [Actinoplanes sp. NPDC049599]|uniref:hypothetical protein n=1 Tax=Actinoplanes sp. NPDC049599 TaxID=3363903 RepID=UPI0037B8F662